jgi:Bacterial archaeo-eukaryotic release factor family 2
MVNLTTLRDMLTHDGPFASVHMDASHDTEDAAKLADLRWRAVRDELTALDTPAATIDALADAIDRPPPVGRAGRLMVAAGDRVLVDEYLAEPPAQPSVRVSACPYLLPLAGWHEHDIPYVAVAVDQIGADLYAVDAHGAVRTEEMAGHDHPVHKVRGGGWSHLSLQRRAEETVRRNITDVAAEVAGLAGRVDARVIIVAGDARARAQLRQALPENHQRLVAEIDHGRPEDPSHHTVDRDIGGILAAQHDADRDELLDRFDRGRAHGLAAQGLPGTTAALRDGNVEVLLIDGRTVGEKTVWTGSDPAMVAAGREELHELGVSGRAELRADEALPAAAIAIGADVFAALGDDPRLELTNGVGAVLRHN